MEAKFKFTTCIILNIAKDWWCKIVQGLEPDVVESMSCDDFVTGFKSEFVHKIEVQQLGTKFLALEQIKESVAEITTKFKERALFCP